MSLAITLACTVVLAWILKKPLKAAPTVFYIAAFVFSVFTVYLTWHPSPLPIIRAITFAAQKGQLGFSLFAVVMFIGVLDKGSLIRRSLTPVRAELSILASILIVGHLVPYAINYLGLTSGLFSLRPSIIASLGIALMLVVLGALLTVTSFNLVKAQMNAGRWKLVQRLAYPFFGLIVFHLLGYLLIPALNGSFEAVLKVGVYAVIFTAYLVLRLHRARLDKKGALERPMAAQ